MLLVFCANVHALMMPSTLSAHPPAPRGSVLLARANSDAQRKAKSVAMRKHARRRTEQVDPVTGVPIKSGSSKARKPKIDVVLLKPVDGLGEAGDIVTVTQAMFENGLHRTGKARLPRAADIQVRHGASDEAAAGAGADAPR